LRPRRWWRPSSSPADAGAGAWRRCRRKPQINQTLFNWIAAGDFTLDLALRLDALSAVMILVVTGIGSLIHLYSTSYMHDETDANSRGFFSYLNLFCFFMLMLVLGSNVLVMFVGWEGVGLCSYLLIGYYYEKQSASDAAKKAFIVNRVGDFAFILGALLLVVTVQLARLQHHRAGGEGDAEGSHLRHAVADHAADVHRRHRQVGADSAVCVAAGRDGRARRRCRR
jgi:NADH:ubiquinone oxidoreductase subunit 5 (subunit L)/multisubunit Na+/H+ antiporter MnhA subunit